ncbi:MAG: UDP-N-acetylmuramate--L-alanine ligase [Firmicutes bacterium]|nr:UDP-N-acetylmuramate--L-alanine ligase [Candidatus Colimorpha enterica]
MNNYYSAEQIEKIVAGAKKIHFIGIGGISMCSLAMITARHGVKVSGSDRTESEIADRMQKLGIEISYEHTAQTVAGAAVVVYRAAIHDDNPELAEARRQGIPTLIRAEYLGWLMLKYGVRIGVAGSHGKSSVTGMIASACMADGDPTVLCGAEVSMLDGTYRLGSDARFVFEACEYCDSFLSFYPTLSVITNVEYDHPDYFTDMDMLRNSFLKYAMIGEKAVFNADDPESVALMNRYGKKAVTYGIENDADYSAKNIVIDGLTSSFTLVCGGEEKGKISLRVPGLLNVKNALCACAAAMTEGISFENVKRGLESFGGIKRRFEHLGKTAKGADVYDDYAHHPTELKATISTAVEALKGSGKRLVTLFQPHTYSRTAALYGDFVEAFGDVDLALFSDIYAAREENVYGVSSKGLAESVGGVYSGSISESAEYIKENCGENDVVLILGAGDIIKAGPMVIKA